MQGKKRGFLALLSAQSAPFLFLLSPLILPKTAL